MQVLERQTHCIRDPASARMRGSLRGFSVLPVYRFVLKRVLGLRVAWFSIALLQLPHHIVIVSVIVALVVDIFCCFSMSWSCGCHPCSEAIEIDLPAHPSARHLCELSGLRSPSRAPPGCFLLPYLSFMFLSFTR